MEIKLAGSAAIIKEKKILLLKRAASQLHFPNHWTFPAGRVDPADKTLAETAKRETKEETGLDLTVERKFGFYESHVLDKRAVSCVFLGRASGDIKLQPEEISDANFFSYEETLGLDIAFSYRQALLDLKNQGLL